MAKQARAQQETIGRVMHEFKHGGLRTGGDGSKVRDPKQAIAIALHEAGATNQETPAKNRANKNRANKNRANKNRANLRRTKAKERRGETAQAEVEGRARGGRSSEPTKRALYAQARRRDIPAAPR